MKLCQVIALCSGKKTRAQRALTEVHHKLQKPQLLDGISRQYRPKDEDGDVLPPEEKRVQFRVKDAVAQARDVLTEVLDVVATLDIANTAARADLIVDGKTIATSMPVTHLLFIEKHLTDLHTFVESMPTLDTAEEWRYSSEADTFCTPRHETTRTKKVPKNHVKAEATAEHPAQVEVFTEDVIVGYWSTAKFSGAIPESVKNQMLVRVRKLQDAVKVAREHGNGVEVDEYRESSKLLDYVFQPMDSASSA